ncbi:MAG: hypothetical protein H0X01_08770 [Nitrospira sp.]|nr:hypothetical protein [Nitrospira sp.]
MDTTWPKPWVFFKTFTFSVLVYVFFVFAVQQFHNPKLLPGLIMTGTFIIPVSLLIFFFRNECAAEGVPVSGRQTRHARGNHVADSLAISV